MWWFLQLYWHVCGDWDLGHRAVNCLVQLASLNGAVLINGLPLLSPFKVNVCHACVGDMEKGDISFVSM